MQRLAIWFIMFRRMPVTTDSALLIVGVHLGMLLLDVAVAGINQMIFAFALIPANLFLSISKRSIFNHFWATSVIKAKINKIKGFALDISIQGTIISL